MKPGTTMTSEKLCLRWNDFERNISEAFREIRDDKDFFDVTLVCEEKQIQAHKIILSACSPFFKKVLLSHHHEHPLIYLMGVKYKDLKAVLNFMYHGQVNVAHDELNSFLQVAEDLKIKGLSLNTVGDRSVSSYTAPEIAEDLELKGTEKLNSDKVHDNPSESQLIEVKEEHILEPEERDNGYNMVNFDENEIEMQEYNESYNQQLLPYNDEDGKTFYYCDECDKKFAYKRSLQKHKLTQHDGVEFPCDQCDHQSKTIVLLKRHINSVHIGVRFPCDQCNYQATTHGNLKVHLQKHEGLRYPCDECHFQATEKGGLKKHKQIVHDGIRYPCDQCSYQATQKRYLFKHIEKQHNNKKDNTKIQY